MDFNLHISVSFPSKILVTLLSMFLGLIIIFRPPVIRYWGIKFYPCLYVSQTGLWFFTGTPVSPANKIDRHDITEILLKVELNTINQTKPTFAQLKYIWTSLVKLLYYHMVMVVIVW